MITWLKRKLDIDPGRRLHEVLWCRLNNLRLTENQNKDPVYTLSGWLKWKLSTMVSGIGELLHCLRLYMKFVNSWADFRESLWHVLAHRRFDAMCEFCHYRRCVKEKIGMGW
jgi:hypothetical protein